MMKMNESGIDRGVRVIVGLLLAGLDLFGVLSGWVGIVGLVVGVVLVLTGMVGFCPISAALKLHTNKTA